MIERVLSPVTVSSVSENRGSLAASETSAGRPLRQIQPATPSFIGIRLSRNVDAAAPTVPLHTSSEVSGSASIRNPATGSKIEPMRSISPAMSRESDPADAISCSIPSRLDRQIRLSVS